jgi:hypothetical protein
MFTDDFGRGTQFLVTGNLGEFIGTSPPIDLMNVRVMRVRNSALVSSVVGRGLVIFGSGTCPLGPGTFKVMKVSLPFMVWLLQDVTP